MHRKAAKIKDNKVRMILILSECEDTNIEMKHYVYLISNAKLCNYVNR